METKINVLSESEHEVEVSLDYSEIKNEIDEAYKKERKSISLPGFRKGHVPLPMLKKIYGEVIEYRASEDIANKKFWEIVEKEKLEPISTPQLADIDFEIGSKLNFKVKYEVKPAIEVKDYKNLEVEKPIFKVKDEDVEAELKSILKAHATFEEAEQIENENYRITVDLQRLDEKDNPIEGSRSENVTIDLDDPKVNPQIPQNALNKKVGETFNFKFVDDHMHGEEVHHEEFNYSAEVKKIEKIVPPEINEEFVEKVSNKKAKTLDDFKEQLKKNFVEYYTKQSEDIYLNSLLNKIVENNEFKVPNGYVDVLEKQMLENEKRNAQMYKMPNFDEAKVREQIRPKAEWNAKWQVILSNIAEAENLKITDEELKEEAKKEAEKTGISEEKLVKYYKDSHKSEALLEEKVINFLKENNPPEEVDPSELNKKKKEEETKEEAKKEN